MAGEAPAFPRPWTKWLEAQDCLSKVELQYYCIGELPFRPASWVELGPKAELISSSFTDDYHKSNLNLLNTGNKSSSVHLSDSLTLLLPLFMISRHSAAAYQQVFLTFFCGQQSWTGKVCHMYRYLTMATSLLPSFDESLWAASDMCSWKLTENKNLDCHRQIAYDWGLRVLLPF